MEVLGSWVRCIPKESPVTVPKNEKTPERLEELSVADRQAYVYKYQEHWYLLGGMLCNGVDVLDVGSGTGYGLPIYWSGGAKEVLGIDLLPASETVQKLPLTNLRDASFDLVSCFDVIEHVEDDRAFLQELLRVSKACVLLTTPNWNVWKCVNRFHVREYNPEELKELLAGQQYCLWTCGKDRVASPVRPIADPDEADASFGVLLRSPNCSSKRWTRIVADAGTLHGGIPVRLSSITRNSEEWVSTAKAVIEGAADPLEASIRLLKWLQSVLCNPPATKELAELTDTTAVLRYGLKSPLQQVRSIAWALNSLIIGPEGPRVNHPKGVKIDDPKH